MADVPQVTITAGIPTGGTGTVETLSTTNAVIGGVTETAPATDTASSGLNGRLQRIAQRITSLFAFFGTTADAKSTATDTTAITAMQVWKQISASVQAMNTAIGSTLWDLGSGTGGTRTQRVYVDTAQLDPVVAHDAADSGSPIKLGGYAKAAAPTDVSADADRVNAWFLRNGAQATVLTAAGALIGGDATNGLDVDLTRVPRTDHYGTMTFTPAASSHVANDCNGAATSCTSMGLVSQSVMITSASLEIDGGTAEATAWRLYLYNVTPPSATADDGAWDLVSGDRASYLGYIDLGTAVDLGSTQYVQVDGINKQIRLAATPSIFAYLVNLTTLTPAAVAHIVTLHTVEV